ncbi:lipid asymmetry maintenance protein MlaB [Ideonella sp.]|jgi:phospholipid transport system transporter-binding protein|uniref:lipid asymmetry maintenance protein MlaB n=1 Tax=Ideonella sp. TaxID=1929293 RepID=UPI0037C02029
MIALPSHLTLREANAVLRSMLPSIAGAAESTITVDAAALTHIDSAALAVLLECKRHAQTHQRELVVVNVPGRLQELAKLYGVEDMLGMSSAAPH